MAEEHGAVGADERRAWLEQRIISSLKIKPEKVSSDEELNIELDDFCNGDGMVLFVTVGERDKVIAAAEPSQSYRRKACYFMKTKQGKLSTDRKEFNSELTCGDIARDPIEQLCPLLESVYLPHVRALWDSGNIPELLVSDSKHAMSDLVSLLTRVGGASQGRTVLPLPMLDQSKQDRKEDLYAMESCVVVWSEQIRGVLDASSDRILEDTPQAGALKLLQFWEDKAVNLAHVQKQLQSDRIRKLMSVLEQARSSYTGAFQQMCSEVQMSEEEACKIVPMLRVLEPSLISLEQGAEEFWMTSAMVLPIFHGLLLLWQHSTHFSSLAYLLTFIRMVLNDVLVQAQAYGDAASIFEVDTPEAIDRIKEAKNVCELVKNHYKRYQDRAAEEVADRPWQLPPTMVFDRLNRFIERCKTIETLLVTIWHFSKLERTEIGSTKGASLTLSIQQVYQDYVVKLKIFDELEYDCFDVDDPRFTADYLQFMGWVSEAEAQIVAIISQAMADMESVETAFKLLRSFEGVVSRTNILVALEKDYLTLLRRYISDLSCITEMFIAQRDEPPIFCNMPELAGALHWTNALRVRACGPMAQFETSCGDTTLLQSDEMKEAKSILQHILNMLEEFNVAKQKMWAIEVDDTIIHKLQLPLLHYVEDTTGLKVLGVNFAPDLVRLLREVRYLIRLQQAELNVEIPPSAQLVYDNSPTYMNHITLLESVVSKFNWIQTNLLAVERPLVQDGLNSIETSLLKGLEGLNWQSAEISQFVSDVAATTKDTTMGLQILKDNVAKIQNVLAAEATSLLQRSDARVYSAEEIQDLVQETCDDRREAFAESSLQVHELVDKSNKAVKVAMGSPIWRDYVGYLNTIIVQGFSKAITVSLHNLMQNINNVENDLLPLVQVSLELEVSGGMTYLGEVIFTPDVSPAGDRVGDLRSMVLGWVRNFHTVFTGMKRVCTGGGSYLVEIEERTELREQVQKIMNMLRANEQKCNELRENFIKFSDLWRNDIQQSFEEWWHINAVSTKQGAEDKDEGASDKKPEMARRGSISVDAPKVEEPKWPTIQAFDKQITKYTALRAEVNELATQTDIGWIRVDCRPIRQQCIYWSEQWLKQYTNFLLQHIVDSMSGLYKFIDLSNATLAQSVSENDEMGLKKVLECVRDVKKSVPKYDGIVEPLRAQVSLLRKFEVAVPEVTLTQMESAQDGWDGTKVKMYETKERLSDLYNKEGAKIKDRAFQFTKDITEFRSTFRQFAPFASEIGWRAAYDALQSQNVVIETYQAELTQLRELQELFELVPGDYREIRDCYQELQLLKGIWDVVALVDLEFTHWKELLWQNINTEYLITECKHLKATVRGLDKKVRLWDVYKKVDDDVMNMLTVLPLIEQLKMPSMRERHWKELMSITKTQFTMDSSFCLSDILAVQLHQHAEAVEGVVIKSHKELVIEKNVAKITEMWDKLELQYYDYPKDDTCKLMRVPEDVVEAREEHQVALQAMQASKYINVFETQVNSWLKKLGTVDSVCQVWLTVQEKWMQLESIFIGSEDIRAQLPEDSKRFDSIDEDWRSLMAQSTPVPNALEVCNTPDQLSKLESMEEMLDMCQKALDEYLGTKRVAFPRFYFVAPADLLDILSKGGNPLDIQQHFSKCFDNISKLEFDPDQVKTGKATHAEGMYSGEGEYVKFHETFDASDQAVENYMQALVDHSHAAIKSSIQEGISTYSADKRDEWLFQFCAQVVLVSTMIWWTIDVNVAFTALEDGMETALKDQLSLQVDQLKKLSALVRGSLIKGDRTKIVTLITIDVHARDVVQGLIRKRVESSSCFDWLSQLRLQWVDDVGETNYHYADNVICDSCDSRFIYGYEYVGNTSRLVITPLTDRCYITLTQALRLKMGGAPAGPAGTGKTETTKDLARALGIICYVFNCSPQMTARVMANIFKGLAASGSWGCFDEFNRINIETLSVVATMFRSVLLGMRALCKLYPAEHSVCGQFLFESEDCSLVPTSMGFITMNPGYAGRTELPENVKALFRAVAMIVPDMEMICEIMLFSEGFEGAKALSRKFMLLFRLNKDLLSMQVHYDWGLRAVKSILVIAGGLKRADPDVPEDGVLMRALRDCNLPKLVLDDVDVFLGVVSDIFPGWDLPRRRELELEQNIKLVCKERVLQPEEIFMTKISALAELLEVRHSVFLLGPSGSGKSSVWRVLQESKCKSGTKALTEVINPKSQDTNEVYGFIHPVLGWKDGVFSFVMRSFAQMENDATKWIVFDGEVDPDWIESLNTVMDDNKTLTLASNERVPLNPTMRLLIEVSNLRNASPATVSRGGVLMLNERDLGWRPFAESWVQSRAMRAEQQLLESLFDEYFDTAFEYMRRNIKAITNVMEINMVMTTCYLLDTLLVEDDKKEILKETTEVYFVYAAVWGLGGALSVDKGVDYRKKFSDWWKLQFQAVSFGDLSIYDLQVDTENHTMVSWERNVTSYQHERDVPIYDIMVPTVESVRLMHLMNQLMVNTHHVQLVGLAGTAKTTLVKEMMKDLSEDWSTCDIFLNSRTTALSLQLRIEAYLEKRAGKTFAPPANKKHIYFLDDLNMPGYDKWGVQNPIELLFQLLDHKFLWDRNKCGLAKEIINVQYVSAMNPTAGVFQVSSRLQRQFACFACNLPSMDTIESMFFPILEGHLSNFNSNVKKYAGNIMNAAVMLHSMMLKHFLPNAVKFHYQWNLRELTNIFQGIMQASSACVSSPAQLSRLWLHEATRTYCDRLMTVEDRELFDHYRLEVATKCLGDCGMDMPTLIEEPLLFADFCADGDDYQALQGSTKLKEVLTESLAEYNESNARMDLVLFQNFMEHVVRVARIIFRPRGNAMVVGVGGSGKQSITKLTAFIRGINVFQIQLTSSYNVNNLREDLANLYKKCLKNEPTVWLLTDQQVVDDGFLVCLNDFLSSGIIADLFTPDDKSDVIAAVRNEVVAEGLQDTNDNCWEFFIDKVRSLLHVVFCVSPVGEKMRNWCRKFPALINCSVLDWVTTWPEEALHSVAVRFLTEASINLGEEEEAEVLRLKIAHHMAVVHQKTVSMCDEYSAIEKRYNYATPKSYLEYIDLYCTLLNKKQTEMQQNQDALERGLQKLQQTEEDVGQLKIRIEDEAKYVAEKSVSVSELLCTVGTETEIVNEQRALAAIENEKADVERTSADTLQNECNFELNKAEPLVAQALGALDSLSKDAIVELKTFNCPPSGVAEVCECIMYMLSEPGKLCKDASFKAMKKEMNMPTEFIKKLKEMNINNIPRPNISRVKVLLEKNKLGMGQQNSPDAVTARSFAAGGMASWVVNVVMYDDCYQMITPLRNNLAGAQASLKAAEAALKIVVDQVTELEEKLQELTDAFEKATTEKNELVKSAERTKLQLVMAERLVGGLSGEKIRWSANIDSMKQVGQQLIGDSAMAAAFVSYIGAFSASFRERLIHENWMPDLMSREIPVTEGSSPLAVLCSATDKAIWANEGLPADQLSVENAAIITSCARWPLMIDPQLQGVTWIKSRENNMKVTQMGKKLLDTMERAVSLGTVLLIDGLTEEIDPVIEPVLSRSTVKRGGMVFIKLGDKDDVEYDPNFRLYLQTKMANPHYPPEVAAQTTLINFTVTEKGLEDQLLAVVVQNERPDLEERLIMLVRESNDFTKQLKELEEALLYKLSHAEGNLIEDIELIESLEKTKVTANEIVEKQKEGKLAETEIGLSREMYRPAATRSSLIYFVLNSLWMVDHMYQYSLNGFMRMFTKAIMRAEASQIVEARVTNVIDSVTLTLFSYASRGLFARHKQIFAAQLCFRIMSQAGEIEPAIFEFLLRCPRHRVDKPTDMEWMPDANWYAAAALSKIDGFDNLLNDLKQSAKRFAEWCNLEASEKEKLPLEYKTLPPLQQLCLIRVLRPDRMTMAVEDFVKGYMGEEFIKDVSASLDKVLPESDAASPVYFILSPGVDVVSEVEKSGIGLGMVAADGKFSDVSLGEGKDVIADREVDRCCKEGGWVVLQNVHLMPRWLLELEKRIERNAPEAHPDFRLFLTSDPTKTIPIALLQRSIKLTQEPPPGLKALCKRSWSLFSDQTWENSSKQTEMKITLFALTFFHGVVIERKKFGPQGWNRAYPFNQGDLTVCKDVLFNYLEAAGTTLPWEDLKYIFGEIMYGGHITDDIDRLLCATYMERFMCNELFEGLELYPQFPSPPNLSHFKLLEYIEEYMETESPIMFGLHPNAELGFRTEQSETLFNTVAELQPRTAAGAGGGDGAGSTQDDKIRSIIEDITDSLAETNAEVDLEDLITRIESEDEGRTPYVNVFYQEVQYMNALVSEMKKSLGTLQLAMGGELQMSEAMEVLGDSLFLAKVPESWKSVSFVSTRPLASWLEDLNRRIHQLQDWVADLILPRVVWLSGMFNPQSFLTAILQSQARRHEWPLDSVVVATDVTKKTVGEIEHAARDGSYIHGLSMEGARWDAGLGCISQSLPKEMFCKMPVMLAKAIPVDKSDFKDAFLCPVYKTKERGYTFVFKANLKTRTPATTWIIAGVALLMDIGT